MNADMLRKENHILLRKVKVLFSLLLLACMVIAVSVVFYMKEQGVIFKEEKDTVSVKPPYFAEVNKIIKPLQYSGFQMFTAEDVYLTLDFAKGIWTLHNIHSFDDNGDFILQEGKYGTCGELAAYTHEKIEPIFKDDYEIKFVMASQSGYFLTPKASHVVLRVSKKSYPRKEYIIDPSFHKYGPIEDFEDYFFLEEMDNLDFLEKKDNNITQQFSSAIPLFIRKDYLVGFTVESMYGNSAMKHFVLALTLNKKHNYAGRYLFALRSINGGTEILEDKKLAREILSEQEWDALTRKIKELFREQVESSGE